MPKTTLIDCCIKKYAYREVSQIYQELEISGEGLSQSQVELMREKYGINSFSLQRLKKLAIPWGWRYNPPTLMGKAEKGEKNIE